MSSHRLSVTAALAFLIAALATSGAQSLWYDELFTVWVASRPWSDLVQQAHLDGFTPPLFYALVKLLSQAGLRLEDLRILPVLLASGAVFLAIEACARLFGPGSRMVAVLLIPTSAYLFTFAHELRPYSAILACSFYFLGQLGGQSTARSDSRAARAALLATAFSYLGLMMVVVWLIECRRRSSRRELAGVSLAAALLGSPGLSKLLKLNLNRAFADSTIVWSADPPTLSRVFFGLSPVPLGGWIEGVALLLLTVVLLTAFRASDVPAVACLARAFLFLTAMLIVLDLAMASGFAPRYWVLPMSALLLLLVGVLPRVGRAAPVLVVLLVGLNTFGIFRYLAVHRAARANWREAMSRIEARLGTDGVLLAFPFHHAAVAASAYAPGLVLAGGYSSRRGPIFWYPPPAHFRGYAFADLQRLDDPAETFGRLSRLSDICLMSDEEDASKTATVFTAFESLGIADALDSGDPRLRVSCRPKGATPGR